MSKMPLLKETFGSSRCLDRCSSSSSNSGRSCSGNSRSNSTSESCSNRRRGGRCGISSSSSSRGSSSSQSCRSNDCRDGCRSGNAVVASARVIARKHSKHKAFNCGKGWGPVSWAVLLGFLAVVTSTYETGVLCQEARAGVMAAAQAAAAAAAEAPTIHMLRVSTADELADAIRETNRLKAAVGVELVSNIWLDRTLPLLEEGADLRIFGECESMPINRCTIDGVERFRVFVASIVAASSSSSSTPSCSISVHNVLVRRARNGVFVGECALRLRDSVFENNHADGLGGAVVRIGPLSGDGRPTPLTVPVSIRRCSFARNTAVGSSSSSSSIGGGSGAGSSSSISGAVIVSLAPPAATGTLRWQSRREHWETSISDLLPQPRERLEQQQESGLDDDEIDAPSSSLLSPASSSPSQPTSMLSVQLDISSSTFSSNQVVGVGSSSSSSSSSGGSSDVGCGGAIAMHNPEDRLTLRDAIFDSNSAVSGGALCMTGTDSSLLSFNSVFSNNRATGGFGGAVSVLSFPRITVKFCRSTFEGNEAGAGAASRNIDFEGDASSSLTFCPRISAGLRHLAYDADEDETWASEMAAAECMGCTGCPADCNRNGRCVVAANDSGDGEEEVACACSRGYDPSQACSACLPFHDAAHNCTECLPGSFPLSQDSTSCTACPGLDKIPFLSSSAASSFLESSTVGSLEECRARFDASPHSARPNVWAYLSRNATTPCGGACLLFLEEDPSAGLCGSDGEAHFVAESQMYYGGAQRLRLLCDGVQ